MAFVHSFQVERLTFVPLDKLFRDVKRNAFHVIPKLDQIILRVQTLQGDGSPGTLLNVIKKPQEGIISKNVVLKVDEIDEAEKKYGYSVVGGTDFDETMTERISYKIKLEESDDSDGCIANISIEFHGKERRNMSDEQVVEQTDVQGFYLFDDIIEVTQEA
ncbi:protein LlR18B-like [Cicer arietinum]|uniref:Protein LlR18B-like n=1 Tax=Cicer arietinum TaxID=3827 RepID=A0A1S2XDV5_CICAR|nr:protein LlR18B-like [Cicer arietinum]